MEVPPVKNEHILEAQSMVVDGDKIGAMDDRVEVFVGIVVGIVVGINVDGPAVGFTDSGGSTVEIIVGIDEGVDFVGMPVGVIVDG